MPQLNLPVIVVPGITATSLEDQYPLSPEVVWSPPLHRQFDRISMHPDDLRYEALEPARVRARSALDPVYHDLIAALRHDLSPRADLPTPVFAFAYDWRQDCARSSDELASFIDEVLARTRLLPHYLAAPPDRVDLVGHSMGGLVIAGLLARQGKDARVRRVVSIGTPFRGAVDAVSKLATGMGTLTGEEPRDREREAARTIPAIYQLLPDYPEAVREPGTNLFDADAWQPSILKTLKEYCRLHKTKIEAEDLFAGLLTKAADCRKTISGLTLGKVLPEGADGWLPIVGVGSPTQVTFSAAKKWFDFLKPENDPQTGRTGDGTVPFFGACPAFLERSRLVCVRPDDFSMWEVKNHAMASVAGFHAMLPTVNLVQRLAIKFLWDKFSGDVWGRKAPGVDETTWPSWLKEPEG